MIQKLAIKKLTASDLTLFEWHFRNRNAGNQKAINLNADVFIAELFPALLKSEQGKAGRISLDLYIYGPGLEGQYNLQRKIIKLGSYKNWRLDGEYILNPDESPARFNELSPGDFVVFDFQGDVSPTAARAVFLAKSNPKDSALCSVLDKTLGDRKMISLTIPQLSLLIGRAKPPDDHPINELILDAALEDAALGGVEGTKKLLSRRSGKHMSRSELERARQNAEEAGRAGEEYINAHLKMLKKKGAIQGFEWVSESNAVAPYDFWLSEDGVSRILLDSKATSGDFDRTLHISMSELHRMCSGPERYDLYRVFEMGETSAKVRIARDVGTFAKQMMTVLESLPPGVQPDGFSVSPSILHFAPTVEIIQMPVEQDED